MINNHVVSLDLAKQLYEAGIRVESEFWWRGYGKDVKNLDWELERGQTFGVENYPAPLASELGEFLPEQIEGHCCIEIGKYLGKWVVQYAKIDNELGGFRVDEDTEANSRAKMLLYLKSKGLL